MQAMENALAGEKSPYLLQHRHNPVDWYPWGEEAFARAARTPQSACPDGSCAEDLAPRLIK